LQRKAQLQVRPSMARDERPIGVVEEEIALQVRA
jgi:hypothetical protein